MLKLGKNVIHSQSNKIYLVDLKNPISYNDNANFYELTDLALLSYLSEYVSYLILILD